ncbi:MAG: hypothetical protein WAT39_13375 [Planctomycetota bacterium]
MRSLPRLVTSVGVTLGLGLLAAASLQPAPGVRPLPTGSLPVLVVQEVDAVSAQAYAARIGEVNRIVRAKWQIEDHVHVFQGASAGDDSGAVFAVRRAESFAALQARNAKIEKDPELLDARSHLAEIRKLGNQVSYKAVRFDGVHAQGAVLNTKAILTDEAAYLKALDGLRVLFDGNGLQDVKINCYRVAAGRTGWSHLISLNCASQERRAVLMDVLGDGTWAQDWMASVNKIRTVVANGSYDEITPAAAAK